MKKLPFEWEKLSRYPALELEVSDILRHRFGGFFHPSDCVVMYPSDKGVWNTGHWDVAKAMVTWVSDYIHMILSDNAAVLRFKEPPYSYRVFQAIDTTKELYQVLFYVDPKVYSLVVGREHKNIVSLVRSLFPVFSKSRYENNLRFMSYDKIGMGVG